MMLLVPILGIERKIISHPRQEHVFGKQRISLADQTDNAVKIECIVLLKLSKWTTHGDYMKASNKTVYAM